MEISALIKKKRYAINMYKPHDISIPVRFDGTSLAAFGAQPALRDMYKTEGFTGDVNRGGSCNCDMLTFSPHLHGTHTECVGHIASTPIHVCDIARDGLVPATLITVSPRQGKHDSDTYNPALRPTDTVITKDQLHRGLLGCNADFMDALIIRTMPNDGKMTRDYSKESPPFFSQEAMHYLINYNVKHLVVDIPSVDRLDDEGKLTNHHIFWKVEAGSHIAGAEPSQKTITELAYIPDTVSDGNYMLNLQIAPIASDAAPSRPMLYEIEEI